MYKNGSILVFMMTLLFGISCSKKQNFDERVIVITQPSKVKGFDPITAGDRYSGEEVSRIYEGLLEFHYLKRPYELSPSLAQKMPSVSDDGLTYTFKLREDIFFHDNECFKDGVGRQMIASDVIYSIKRLADPKAGGLGWWLINGKIKGLNKWRKRNLRSKSVDYSTEIEGIKATGKFTVQFKLTKKSPQFLYSLAMPYTFVVPIEAVEMYGKEFLNHPVGTGPFVTEPYKQGAKIVYYRNKKYRDTYYPEIGEIGDDEKGLLKDKGKKLPLLDKIIVVIQTEDQPRWLSFEKGKTDFLKVPKDNFESVIIPGKGISQNYKKKGILLNASPDLDVTYIAFNHSDPLFKNNKLLKQAMSTAYNGRKANELFYNNQAVVAQGVIPPGIAGYTAQKNPYKQYNIEKAKQLLVKAGYPGGKGLPVIKFEHKADSTHRQMAEFFQKQMKLIGINIEINGNTWPQLVRKVNSQQAQMFAMAWGADYPDAENFLQLLYGKNSAPGANGANYDNEEFNNLYEIASVMQDSPKRTKLYEQLNEMLIDATPWIFGVHRVKYVVHHGWLENYKFTAFTHGRSKYFNIDLAKKKELYKKL